MYNPLMTRPGRARRPARACALAVLAFFLAPFLTSNAQTEGLEPAPEPPPLPARIESGEVMEPDITIIQRDEETVVEYRVAGKLRAIKVIPKDDAFPPYYLVDVDGDGRLELHRARGGLQPDFLVNTWTILSW